MTLVRAKGFISIPRVLPIMGAITEPGDALFFGPVKIKDAEGKTGFIHPINKKGYCINFEHGPLPQNNLPNWSNYHLPDFPQLDNFLTKNNFEINRAGHDSTIIIINMFTNKINPPGYSYK